jgi:hypothetical protein
MPNDIASKSGSAPRRGRWLGRAWRHPAAKSSSPDLILLRSIGRTVLLADVLDDPHTALLATEDGCWQFAMEQHLAVRPRPWHRSERRDWQVISQALEDKRGRLSELAGEVRTWAAPGAH